MAITSRVVGKVGDGAKALCLALCAKIAAGFVEALERCVLLRFDGRFDFENKSVGRGKDCQLLRLTFEIILPQCRAVEFDRDELKFAAVEMEGLPRGVRQQRNGQPRAYVRHVLIEVEAQVHRVEPIGRRLVVLQKDWLEGIVGHT